MFYDTFIGDAGANRLNGARGADTLTGAGGADTFVMDTMLDGFINVDTIIDFAPGVDRVELAQAIFGLPLGALGPGVFSNGPATTADQRIVYDAASGVLSYDADGSGSGAAVAFAVIANHAALSAGDFFVA